MKTTKFKSGVSLIVLVITIIIMIILAGTIILTLGNQGIIDKTQDAVDEYNIDEVQSLASMKWTEAFTDGARTKNN